MQRQKRLLPTRSKERQKQKKLLPTRPKERQKKKKPLPESGQEFWPQPGGNGRFLRWSCSLALSQADFSEVRELAIDETSRARGHEYVTIAADAERRAVIFVTETREATAIERLAMDLTAHGGDPEAIDAVSIDMSPAYIKGVEAHLHNATITLPRSLP